MRVSLRAAGAAFAAGCVALVGTGCTTLQRPVPAAAGPSAPAPDQRIVRFGTAPGAAPTATAPQGEAAWGAYFYRRGDFRRSIQLLADAVKKDPANATLWRNLGSSYALDDDFDAAISCFQSAIRRDPKDTKSLYDLSVVEGWKGSLPQAEKAALKGLALAPRHGGLHSSLGNVYDDEGKENASLKQYADALEINPRDTITRFNRGGVYLKLKDLGAAEKDYHRVLKLDPDDLGAAQNLAAVYFLEGRLKAAERLNAWVVRRHPKDEDTLENAYFNLGLIYDREDRIEHALNMYQLALQVAPWDAAAYVNAAVVLERLDRKREALAYWEKYERLFPASRRAAEIAKRIAILKRMLALERSPPPAGRGAGR